MKKFTDFIVEHKNIILIIFVFLTGISLYGSTKVNINSDITKYLPKTSETRIGKDIMDSSFKEQKSSELNVMFKGLTSSEKEETLENILELVGDYSKKFVIFADSDDNKHTTDLDVLHEKFVQHYNKSTDINGNSK